METLAYLPFWNKLTSKQKELLTAAAREFNYKKGSLLHNGSMDCVGLFIVKNGQLRVFTISEEGRELTLYRLFDRDVCLLSASCMIRGLQFDVMVSTEKDTSVLHIPTAIYQQLMEESIIVSNYTNELMASHFSEVMWLMDQIMNKKLDTRLAAFLMEESELRGETKLVLTHEQIANHLGSVREVVTRMLKHFQDDGLLKLGRGSIELLDVERLNELASVSLR